MDYIPTMLRREEMAQEKYEKKLFRCACCGERTNRGYRVDDRVYCPDCELFAWHRIRDDFWVEVDDG